MIVERINVKESGAAVARNATSNVPYHNDDFRASVIREVGDVNVREVEPATFVPKIVFVFAIFQVDVDTFVFAPREAVGIRAVFEIDSMEVGGDICRRCDWMQSRGK